MRHIVVSRVRIISTCNSTRKIVIKFPQKMKAYQHYIYKNSNQGPPSDHPLAIGNSADFKRLLRIWNFHILRILFGVYRVLPRGHQNRLLGADSVPWRSTLLVPHMRLHRIWTIEIFEYRLILYGSRNTVQRRSLSSDIESWSDHKLLQTVFIYARL